MRKATRRGGWACANRTRRSPPIPVCLCRICSTSLGTDLSVPRPCLWAAWGGALWARVCPRSASAHEIEERGARHLGLHLEGGLKLRVALGDGAHHALRFHGLTRTGDRPGPRGHPPTRPKGRALGHSGLSPG